MLPVILIPGGRLPGFLNARMTLGVVLDAMRADWKGEIGSMRSDRRLGARYECTLMAPFYYAVCQEGGPEAVECAAALVGVNVGRPVGALAHFRWLRLGLLGGHQDSFAQEVKVGTAIHLPFEHLDAVDVAFHRAGVPRLGQARSDGGEVVLDTGDEGVQAGQADRAGLVEPSGEPFTAAAGDHDGEAADAVMQGDRKSVV